MLSRFFDSKIFKTIVLLFCFFELIRLSIISVQYVFSYYEKIKHESEKEERVVKDEQIVKRRSCRIPVYIPEDSLRYLPKDMKFTQDEFQLYKQIYEVYFMGQPPVAFKEHKEGGLSEETLRIIHDYVQDREEQGKKTKPPGHGNRTTYIKDYIKELEEYVARTENQRYKDCTQYLEDLLPTLSKETLSVMLALLRGYEERLYDCGGDFGAWSESRSYNYLYNWIDDLAGTRIYEKIYTGKYDKYLHGGGGYAALEFKADTGELLQLIIRAGETLTVGEDSPGVGDRVKVYLLGNDGYYCLVGKEEKLAIEQPAASKEKNAE